MKKNDSNNEGLHDNISNIGNGYPKTQKSLSLSEKNSEKISGNA